MEANKELPSVLSQYWPSARDINDMQQLAETYAAERDIIERDAYRLLKANDSEMKEKLSLYEAEIESYEHDAKLYADMADKAKNSRNLIIQDSMLQRQMLIEEETARINILNLWLEQQKEKLKNK